MGFVWTLEILDVRLEFAGVNPGAWSSIRNYFRRDVIPDVIQRDF